MKTVFNNHEIAKVWVEQNQEHGKNTTGSIFFEGPSIYSYGYHFEMARILDTDTVQISTGTYSVTTSAHQSHVLQALVPFHKRDDSHTIYSLTFDDHTRNIKHFKRKIEEFEGKLKRARTRKDDYKMSIGWQEQCMKNYMEYYKLDKA